MDKTKEEMADEENICKWDRYLHSKQDSLHSVPGKQCNVTKVYVYLVIQWNNLLWLG